MKKPRRHEVAGADDRNVMKKSRKAAILSQLHSAAVRATFDPSSDAASQRSQRVGYRLVDILFSGIDYNGAQGPEIRSDVAAGFDRSVAAFRQTDH